jgi:hypothetical protein
MFALRDVLIDGVIAGLLCGAFVYVLPWARLRLRFVTVAVASTVGFVAWNLVISHAKASGLDVDAPVIALSWQDAGSGVLAFAASALALALLEPREQAIRPTTAAAVAGLAAMVWDIFVL